MQQSDGLRMFPEQGTVSGRGRRCQEKLRPADTPGAPCSHPQSAPISPIHPPSPPTYSPTVKPPRSGAMPSLLPNPLLLLAYPYLPPPDAPAAPLCGATTSLLDWLTRHTSTQPPDHPPSPPHPPPHPLPPDLPARATSSTATRTTAPSSTPCSAASWPLTSHSSYSRTRSSRLTAAVCARACMCV